jgi:fluoride ion exporter CrcB/FEX
MTTERHMFGLSEEWLVTLKLAASGAAGSLVRHLALREGIKDALSTLTVGTLMAVFFGPFLVPLWSINGLIQTAGVSPDRVLMLSGFCTGVAAMALTGFIIDVVKARTGKVDKS